MLGNHGRGLTKALFTRPARALGRRGGTPPRLAGTGTAQAGTAAGHRRPTGHFVAGPLVLLVVLVADSFDGILARATGKSSVFGAFLDSTMDRLADGAVLGSLAAWAALSMPVGALRTVTVAAALVAVVMAATVPYARARAESIGASASVGIAERTDRLLVALGSTFLVGLGAPQWVLTVGLLYVAVASFITVIQRVRAVHQQVGQEGEKQ